jgi:hypothetical protein
MKSRDPNQLLVELVKILNRLKIPYMVTGGIAILLWGRVRLTSDIDVIIELKKEQIKSLREALLPLSKAAYVDVDAMEEALKTNGEFNFIDGDSGLKIDFWILKDNDPFDVSRFKRRVYEMSFGERVAFTTAEDLLLAKLKWFSESNSLRQWEDVESIIKVSGPKFDRAYLREWADKLGLTKLIKKLGI